MKRLIVLVCVCVCALLVFAPAASATVLTFDDITTGDMAVIPDGYGGLDWDQFYVEDPVLRGNTSSGYYNGLVSGNYVAFNAWASVATTSDDGFDFNGAYLTGAWNHGLNVTVTGYDDAVQLYQQTVVTSFYSPTWFPFAFTGVDEVVFSSFGGTPVPNTGGAGTHFAMDNFTYGEEKVIPEPTTLSLLGLGLAGLALSRRIRRK